MKTRLQAIVRLALKSNAYIVRITNGFADTSIELEIDGLTNKIREKFADYKLIPYLKSLTHFYKANGRRNFNYYLDGIKVPLQICFVKHHNDDIAVLNISGIGLKN